MKKLLLLLIPVLLFSSLSCKKNSDPPAPTTYASYKINGVSENLNYASNFSKDFCSTSTFCCRFSATTDIDTTNQESLNIGIPGDPIVGYVYYSKIYRFSCLYINKTGLRYDLTSSNSSMFSLVFTQWDGQGGWGKGYFSGWMKSATNDSILFQNGYFQNKIWTMGTK